jgi:TetR/AcrR family transcriptional regulator, tetracycline repressor protein
MARLRAMFEGSRALAIRHPHAYILLPTRRFNTPKQFAFYERMLATFKEAGFDARQSAHFFRLLASVSTGAGLAEVASRAQQADSTPVKLENFRDAKRYPLVSAVAPHLEVSRLDALFRFHLDIVFEAMAKALRKR